MKKHYELKYEINNNPYEGHFWSTGNSYEEEKISAIHTILLNHTGVREDEITLIDFQEIK